MTIIDFKYIVEKEVLGKNIDEALDNKNKTKFLQLSDALNKIVKEKRISLIKVKSENKLNKIQNYLKEIEAELTEEDKKRLELNFIEIQLNFALDSKNIKLFNTLSDRYKILIKQDVSNDLFLN